MCNSVKIRDHNRRERGSHQVIPLGYLYFKKVIFRNYAYHVETASGELVDFRKTRFHDSVR